MKDLKKLGFDFSENDPHEVLQSFWYHIQNYDVGPVKNLPLGSLIGIVETRDPITEEIIRYIGIGNGEDQDYDEYFIIKTGSKFDFRFLKSQFDTEGD